jgi:hypothetical protein
MGRGDGVFSVDFLHLTFGFLLLGMGGFDWHTFLFEYGEGRCSRDDHVLDDESLYILVQES